MPLYEYKCNKCGKLSIFLEKITEKQAFWKKWKEKRCSSCGSRNLTRVISSFSVQSKTSTPQMLNDLSKMGPVKFVPDYRMPGPPPGGCPYAKE